MRHPVVIRRNLPWVAHGDVPGCESGAHRPTGITCVTCHAQGSEGRRVGPLRAGASKDACRGCHDELVANRSDYLSWCSQWGIFDGTGGAEVPGIDYPGSAHTEMEAGCITCHMATAAEGLDPLAVGGHTFRVKTKGESPADVARRKGHEDRA